jgi:uncharacterized protein (TIGR02301 family)
MRNQFISTMPHCRACRVFRRNIMLVPNMLRISTIIALTFCLGISLALPAQAQYWGAPLAHAPAPAPRPPAPVGPPSRGGPDAPAYPFDSTQPSNPAKAAVPGKLPGQAAAKPAGPPQPPPPEPPAPYDHDLQRLSEILGALHFLRGICDSSEGQKWRTEAQALIDAEAPAGDRHDQMVASFNRGYRGFQQSYRTCTASADVVIRRYLDEGARIARDITARYAN